MYMVQYLGNNWYGTTYMAALIRGTVDSEIVVLTCTVHGHTRYQYNKMWTCINIV